MYEIISTQMYELTSTQMYELMSTQMYELISSQMYELISSQSSGAILLFIWIHCLYLKMLMHLHRGSDISAYVFLIY